MADGFFESYIDDSPGGNQYVSGDEKELLAAEGTVFAIKSVKFEETGGYKDTPRFLLGITLNDEDRKLGFQAEAVDSRDRMLTAMADYFANGGAPVNARIEQAGRSQLITAA